VRRKDNRASREETDAFTGAGSWRGCDAPANEPDDVSGLICNSNQRNFFLSFHGPFWVSSAGCPSESLRGTHTVKRWVMEHRTALAGKHKTQFIACRERMQGKFADLF